MAYHYQIIIYRDGERAYEAEDVSSNLDALRENLRDMADEAVTELEQEND